ncbi:uncharacterized protein FOMMEDRAFT_125285 [Fomitiporia mediterranea MF3/22]|uniref:uncharacterized protein n=1 Tax=Fomitiporia mediterranea (strain MF3/22) TaxID=694068 RepID=UPI000440766B|nr:uncharacterized protein FOMMEDRAFT_125285 [Fomitiporia mediterranea MF3/22]EJD00821.1 hypothetical protein FOMMEDRAFT_125285 [Fomitiporia mediterranea MF3/22]
MTGNLSPSLAVYQPLPQTPDVVDELVDEFLQEQPHAEVHVGGRIRWVHFIFGCAVLLPWNALITATPYFLSRLSGSPMKSSFSSYLSITFTLANFCFLAHATVTSKQSSPARRIFVATSLLAVLVGLLTLSTSTPSSTGIFFAFVLLNGIVQAGAGSYLQTAVVAVASLFGHSAMHACMAGQAFVGVVVSTVQLLSSLASVSASAKAREKNQEYDEGGAEARAAALFFGLSTVFLCATLGALSWLVRLPEYKAVMRPFEEERRKGREGSEGGGVDVDIDAKSEKGRIWRVAKANVEYEFAVGYVFTVTLAVFPPITASILPADPATFHPLIFTAIHFLLFNVGDLTGRYLCAVPRLLTWSSRRLLVLSLARTLFIPLFLLCNVQRPSPSSSPSSSTLPSSALSLGSDAFFFLILLLFGLSNGYVSSMCMIAAPNVQHNKKLGGRKGDVDVAATLASFVLVGGLVVGSACSFLVRWRVCGCNPFVE